MVLKFLAFLNVCTLEFGKGVLSVLDMGRGGTLEIFFDPLSCAILCFLECCKRVNDVHHERIQESLSGLSFSFHIISDFIPCRPGSIRFDTSVEESVYSFRLLM